MNAYININDSDLHDALNSAIAKHIKALDLEKVVTKAVETKLEYLVRKNISDGSFVLSVAKKVAGTIEISDIKDLIDVESLNAMVSDRLSKSLLNKMIFEK